MKLMEKIKSFKMRLVIAGNCSDVVANSLLVNGIDFIYMDEIKIKHYSIQDIDKIIKITASCRILLCNFQILSKIEHNMNRSCMKIMRTKSIKTYFLKNYYYYSFCPFFDTVELETKKVFGKTILL